MFYQNSSPSIQLAKIFSLLSQEKEELRKELRNPDKWQVQIVAYCLLPNHFHFLLKQTKEKGIENFIRWTTNSYSHYFNTKYQRKGALFEGRFKAIIIETNEQLLHLSRYIHLNPYSSYLVKTLTQLQNYPYSSFPEYLQKTKESFCQKKIILDQFKSSQHYQKLVFDQTNYQRTLQQIKNQVLEENKYPGSS